MYSYIPEILASRSYNVEFCKLHVLYSTLPASSGHYTFKRIQFRKGRKTKQLIKIVAILDIIFII